MSADDKNIKRVAELIAQGEAIVQKPAIGLHGIEYAQYDNFHGWRAQSINCLNSLLGIDNAYVTGFDKAATSSHISDAKAGLQILKNVHSDLLNGYVESPQLLSPLLLVEQICTRFHRIARQLRKRHSARATLEIQDEYDVQDLFHALLCLHFEDIRPEEYTPSYAGNSTRMDFLLKREAIVIELKKTRSGLRRQELVSQLAEDKERYKSHPGCKTLVCFVYDPEKLIVNPRGVEADLNRDGEPFPVKVFIRPFP